MSSEDSFIRVRRVSDIGHEPTQSSRSSNSAPNPQGTTYVRVGRGIVPVNRYDKSVTRSRSTAGDLATKSIYGVGGELSPEGAMKPKWYKQPFSRVRHLSLQATPSVRAASTTDLTRISETSQEVESPISTIAPARVEQNEAGPSKLRKPQSRSQLHSAPVSQHNPRNLASSTPPPPCSARNMYNQPPSAQDEAEEDELEDGQILLDLLGVNDAPSAPSSATEQARLHRLPTLEPEPERELEVEVEQEQEPVEPDQTPPPRIRRLPPVPVPVLNIIPPHDSQDAFSYVFGPNHRGYVEHRGLAAPPPYVARQSAILDRYARPTREQLIHPDQKAEVPLPRVAPLSIRRKVRNQGETES